MIVLVAGAIVFVIVRSRQPEVKTWWDILRNPRSMPDYAEAEREISGTATELSGDEAAVASLVDFYVFEAASADGAWHEGRVLSELGEQAYPRALEILSDRSLHAKLVVLTKPEDALPEAPIMRLCKLFDFETPPPFEAAALLEPFYESGSEAIRKNVALIIGSIGLSDSLPILKRMLADEAEYVRSYALMGIDRAVDGKRIHPDAIGAFFDLVAEMWPADTAFEVCDSIPSILLELERERAVERLMRDDLFTAEFEPVWRILQAFDAHAVEVPREKLVKLIASVKAEPLKYPLDNVLEEAITLLGAHRHADDLPMLERFLQHPNKDVMRGAVAGLRKYHRFEESARDPWKVWDTQGWQALTTVEQHVLAVQVLDGEVRNGGFAQYFFNSSGNNWPSALAGLEAIGATKHLALLQTICDQFPDSKPSTDHDARQDQLASIVRRHEDPFSEQDSAWYKIKDEYLQKLIFLYEMKNVEAGEK